MEHAMMQGTGWIVTPVHAWAVLAVWVVIVLAHGLWRSRGQAPQDPIRASGPTE